MKWIAFLLLFSLSTVSAQEMYYFTTKDSVHVGVKKGNQVIVPLEKHRITYYIDFNEPITTPIFELPGSFVNKPFSKEQVATPVNTIYNLQGKPLYYTLLFDNGSDYYQEDVQRIVSLDTGKVGFANDEGTIVIKPEWDFVAPFNYGYAEVMNDVKKQYLDEEHWSVVAKSADSFSGYINKKGQIVKPYTHREHPKDYMISETEFLPYPFEYSSKEQSILSMFQKYYEVLNNISLSNLSTDGTKEEASLQFEIIRSPSKYFPYYKILAYRFQRVEDSFTFLYDEKEHAFYYIEYPFHISNETLVPINNYIINRLAGICEAYKNPTYERQFTFDACKMYNEWRIDSK